MTLSQLATFICGKVNQSETEDVAACKGFLTRRHDLIWQEALWKDSLVEYRQTLDPDAADYTVASNWLPAKGVLLLPPIIQRVLAARTSTRKLNVQRPEYFYRIDYDAFAKTGEAAEYVLLPPCVWEWETAQYVLLMRGAAADATSSLSLDLLDSDGVGVTRYTQTLDGDFKKLSAQSDRIDAVTGAARSAATVIGAPGLCTLVNNSSIAVDVYFASDAITEVNGDYDYQLAAGDSVEVSPQAYVAVIAAGSGGVPDFTAGISGGVAYAGTITLTDVGIAVGGRLTPSGVTLAAADTNAKKRQRVRMIEIPTTETTIRILGKRSAPAFSADNDEPGIPGMENVLIAFGIGDMLQRDESYGEATGQFQEAMALLDQLKKIETVQQAHHSAITPEYGYGDDSFFSGRADSGNPLGW